MPEKPANAELVASAQELVELVTPLLEASEAGTGETVEITLTVPKEWAILAAWCQARQKRGANGSAIRNWYLHAMNDQFLADWDTAQMMVRPEGAKYAHLFEDDLPF